MKLYLTCMIALLSFSCANEKNNIQVNYIGKIERLDPALDAIIDKDVNCEIIAEGFDWSEGPLWVESEKMLLFSDVPKNIIYKWTEEKGKEVYLQPSGYTGTNPTKSKEPGANGLLLDDKGNLVLCQHGNRQMARMDAPLNIPASKFITLADNYDGKKFSSPNDAVFNSKGELFLTDPPYGLPTRSDDDSTKEIPFNGVFRLGLDGKVTVIADSIIRPNGIAFFPGETKLLVACSDPAKPNWYLIDLSPGGTAIQPKIFYTAETKGVKGLPDGLKIDKNGIVFASGPGGVWIFNSDAKVLGKIKLDDPCSNIAFSPDQKTIYITNDMRVLRLKMRK